MFPKIFKLFVSPMFLTLSVSDEGYSRNAWSAINYIAMCVVYALHFKILRKQKDV